MWRLGLILLLLTRIESLQCPQRCHCVQTASSAIKGGNTTFQITCRELQDLPTVLRHLPSPTTQLILQQAGFSSPQALHQILIETANVLPDLTDFSITNSLVRAVQYQTALVKEFLPFASIPNPVPRVPGFTHLQILNLSNNTLTYLPAGLFHSCSSLQTLDLSDNLIKNFETEIFHPLINLLRLDLRQNRLRLLNEAIFRNLSKLLTLDVSHNEISRVAPTTFQYLSSLNTLILAGNPLSASLVLLSAGRHLQVVDVSGTGLRQAPTALERTVRTLQLQGNLLAAVRCGDLDSYSLLSILNLNSNHISYVEEDAMGRLELLAELHLAHNKLFHVPRSLPENLQVLDLSFNLIQNVSNSDFLNLSMLKELSLSNNQIHHIEESAFASLVSLRTLDLSRNPVLVLPPLAGLTQLKVLNLSYLTNVSRAWRLGFRAFPVPSPGSVEELRLEASPALSLLFLTDTSTLQRFTALSELHLRFSNLTAFRRDIFGLLPGLRILQLEGNPWHCDREMLVTAHWLRIHGAGGSEDGNAVNTMHCATPSRLHGKPLVALSLTDFKEVPGKIYPIEKVDTLEILKNQSSFKGVQQNPSGAGIYLKSYENSIESLDNGDAKIEKTSNALEGYRRESKPEGLGDNDGGLRDPSTSSLNAGSGEVNTSQSLLNSSQYENSVFYEPEIVASARNFSMGSSVSKQLTVQDEMLTNVSKNTTLIPEISKYISEPTTTQIQTNTPSEIQYTKTVEVTSIKPESITLRTDNIEKSGPLLWRSGFSPITSEQIASWTKSGSMQVESAKLTKRLHFSSLVSSASSSEGPPTQGSRIEVNTHVGDLKPFSEMGSSSPPFGTTTIWSEVTDSDVNRTLSDVNVNKTGADALSAQQAPPSSHPGLLVMVFVGVVVAAAMALTVQHVARTRRDQGYVLQDQEMEIHSISSAANDLW